jgi:hypothetical protein
MTKGQENAGGAMKYDEKWQAPGPLPDEGLSALLRQ